MAVPQAATRTPGHRRPPAIRPPLPRARTADRIRVPPSRPVSRSAAGAARPRRRRRAVVTTVARKRCCQACPPATATAMETDTDAAGVSRAASRPPHRPADPLTPPLAQMGTATRTAATSRPPLPLPARAPAHRPGAAKTADPGAGVTTSTREPASGSTSGRLARTPASAAQPPGAQGRVARWCGPPRER
jgi:hypothetical protein